MDSRLEYSSSYDNERKSCTNYTKGQKLDESKFENVKFTGYPGVPYKGRNYTEKKKICPCTDVKRTVHCNFLSNVTHNNNVK